MKLHRFYVGQMDLAPDFWLREPTLYHQWIRVLRFRPGREVALFNSKKQEYLYAISKIGDEAVHLAMVEKRTAVVPDTKMTLCFALLKKDKTDWVLQKATELGVSTLQPIVTDRTEKTGFVLERAQKIVQEAAEQCGRTDIPKVHMPTSLSQVIEASSTQEVFIAEQGTSVHSIDKSSIPSSRMILVGPEGGWSDDEKQLFASLDLQYVSLSKFTLRAETACIVAASHFA